MHHISVKERGEGVARNTNVSYTLNVVDAQGCVCRGFAFVDFLSHQEAVNAMEALAGTHLYGRRLVTEWAAQDEGLEELRNKTAAKFQDAVQ